MKEILSFLRACGVFYLATEEKGLPHVRPFGAVAEFEGKIYLITGNKKAVFSQLTKNPKVEISGMTPDGRWLRLKASAVRDGRTEAKCAMLEQNPDLKRLYSVDDGIMEVFFLTEADAQICSFTEAPRSFRF